MTARLRRTPTWAWWLAGLALLLALVAVPGVRRFLAEAWTALSSDDASVRRAWVDHFGVWGPVALIGGMLLQAALPLLPAAADVMIASLAYGPYLGFAIVYTGTLLGAVLGYFLGRAVGGALIRRLAGETLTARTEAFARERGWQSVLIIRLMPALKAEVMNLVAGAVGIAFWPFFLASAAGALPATALVVWLAATPKRLFWGVVLFSAVTGLVLLFRWIGRRRKLKRAARLVAAAR